MLHLYYTKSCIVHVILVLYTLHYYYTGIVHVTLLLHYYYTSIAHVTQYCTCYTRILHATLVLCMLQFIIAPL